MAEPISLTIGGRSMWGVAVVDNEAEDNMDDLAISNDVRIVFKGSTVLDGGLEVGMRIDADGGTGEDKDSVIGEYAYVSGSFGQLRVGNQDTASYKMSTSAPYATFFYGINTPFWTGHISSAGTISTYAGAGVGGASLMYFSPVINGFQFGASYTPEAGTKAHSNTVYSQEGNDAWSIGTRYDGAFGDTGITFAAGVTSWDVAMSKAEVVNRGAGLVTADDAVTATATAGKCPEGTEAVQADLTASNTDASNIFCYTAPEAGRTETDWNAGLVVSMSGVSVGGSYRTTDHDQKNVDDTVQYDVGISYGEGPWAVSANYGNKSQDSEDIDNDLARLMATYNLGPGINAAAVLGSDSPNAGKNKGKDTTFGAVALLISF